MKITMRREYGQLKVGSTYTVDSTTGGTLVERGLAVEAKAKKRRRKRKAASVVEAE